MIDNALKYGVGATKIQLLAEDMGSEIVITVKNNGEMIPQSVLKCLFERFFQSDKSQSLKNGGSGLGLAIVQAIVRNHEGVIQAISNHEWTINCNIKPSTHQNSVNQHVKHCPGKGGDFLRCFFLKKYYL
ncbi:MAG: ATP-binding protein, partial [Lactobacillales bacterium]|nr:ATP-binding protein [Lactobacillales bacterium]